MLSRRRFLQSGSVAAGVSLALPALAHSVADDKPPAIAALHSRRNEAKPITIEERTQRQERARQLMRDNNLSAVFLSQGTSLAYFTGIHWQGGERLFAMVLPAKGDAFYVSPAFEEGRAREQIAQAPEGVKPDVRIWQEDESPYQRVAQGLTDRGLSAGTIGVEETVKFVFSDNIRKAVSGPTFPHGSVTPQSIKEGTIVMMDGGCSAEGYQSDITRTYVLGKASDKMKQVFDIVYRAQSAALAAAKPGVETGSVDAAARQVITDAGYGPDYKYFTHRLGHGMGMDGHEWPYLVRGNATKLQPEMTFSDEPGIYIRGEFGIRLEDDMHITEKGSELFTPQSPSLEDPFGKE